TGCGKPWRWTRTTPRCGGCGSSCGCTRWRRGDPGRGAGSAGRAGGSSRGVGPGCRRRLEGRRRRTVWGRRWGGGGDHAPGHGELGGALLAQDAGVLLAVGGAGGESAGALVDEEHEHEADGEDRGEG